MTTDVLGSSALSTRAWVRWFRSLRARSVPTWYHPTYRLPIPPSHVVPGMSARRAVDALTWALDVGVIRPEDVRIADELRWSDAERVHDRAYLEWLDDPEVVGDVMGVPPAIVNVPAVLETWRRAAGATLDAARWVQLHGGRAANLLGGFHHAAPARGTGFCAFNDVAIAVRALRHDGFDGRVVIIDLDAHPPDGLVESLGDDPLVTVLSVSVRSEWTLPSPTRAVVVDRRVEPGCPGSEYLQAVWRILHHVPSRAALAFYLAGADPLDGDPLGSLGVPEAGLRARDRRVLRKLGRTPTVVLPAGGYTEASWRVFAGCLAEAAGLRTAVSEAFDPVLRRTLDVSRRLDRSTLEGRADGLTDEELLESMGVPVRNREARFLGFYTRHGLEYAFAAHGYLPALRRLGFQGLEVHVETSDGPDRVRLTAQVNGEPRTLLDLSASVRTIGDWRVLFLEWVELRDPRLHFTSDRPRLPGQHQPGLGLAEETGALMARAAERLQLDALALEPAHYHIAWMGRSRFAFVDPRRRGEQRALERYLKGVPLVVASQLLAEGLPLRDGQTYTWAPAEMVAPVKAHVRAALDETEPEARAADEALTSRLLPRGDVLS